MHRALNSPKRRFPARAVVSKLERKAEADLQWQHDQYSDSLSRLDTRATEQDSILEKRMDTEHKQWTAACAVRARRGV